MTERPQLTYVAAVVEVYLKLPDTPQRAKQPDRALAARWETEEIPVSLVESALLLASLRRLSVSACANGARLPRFGPSTGVERLALSGLSCRDLSELGHLTELVSLGLHSITGLADLNALSACSRLSRLRINQCRGLGGVCSS